MQLMVSFVGGLMLGTGLFHMIPHAMAQVKSIDRVMWWVMMGLLATFFLIRLFHFHQHHVAEEPASHTDHPEPHYHDADRHHDHAENDHAHSHYSWLGVFIGLSVHSFIDGLALGASMKADWLHGAHWGLFGLGTFLAIALHIPLDAVTITSIMTKRGWSSFSTSMINGVFAAMCPLGVILFFLGLTQSTLSENLIVGCALAFSAGVFICIALSDLLPEIEFHSHDRLQLSLALVLGISVAYGICFLEAGHAHGESQKQQSTKSINWLRIEGSRHRGSCSSFACSAMNINVVAEQHDFWLCQL